MAMVSFSVPLVPPSVNHYKMRTRKGVTFVSKEALAFKKAIGIFAARPAMNFEKAKAYSVSVTIYQGKGDKGDVDNYAKCVLDGLAEAGVVHSDAAITDLFLRKRRDWENPRTEIQVSAL